MTSIPREVAEATASQLVMPQSTVTSTEQRPFASSALSRDSGVKPYPSSKRCGMNEWTMAPFCASTHDNSALAVMPSVS